MSALPHSSTFLAHDIKNDTYEREGFSKFFDSWLSERDQYLQELISVSKKYNQNADPNTTTTSTAESSTHDQVVREPVLCPLINRVTQHYEHYHGAKSKWAKQDVPAMLSPSWMSSLEDAFLWRGRWRPSMAFHLLYSNSGLQLEEHLADLIRGLRTGDWEISRRVNSTGWMRCKGGRLWIRRSLRRSWQSIRKRWPTLRWWSCRTR